MKTLVLQLARLGDIYQTYPVLKALRRESPDEQIDLLVRSKFSDATIGFDDVVDRIHQLDTKALLKPIIFEDNWKSSFKYCDAFLDSLADQKYDKIVNLSFSPVSSYITDRICHKGTEVRGYTRFQDGYLHIPDDASAYFYGQAGLDKYNRAHLTQLFAGTAGVDLTESDFHFVPKFVSDKSIFTKFAGLDNREPYLVVHVGASRAEKTIAPKDWAQVIIKIQSVWNGKVVLVGGKDEISVGEDIQKAVNSPRVVVCIGRTTLQELSTLLNQAVVAVGGDSLVMALGSVLGVKCLNLSFPSVRFWETGPFSEGSRVLLFSSPESISIEGIVLELNSLIVGSQPSSTTFVCSRDSFVYYNCENKDQCFQWELIKSLYMGDDFPKINTEKDQNCILDLAQLTSIALDQFHALNRNASDEQAKKVLFKVDQSLNSLKDKSGEMRPLIDWFQVERLRIGPGDFRTILEKTQSIFEKFAQILSMFIEVKFAPKEEENGNARVY